MARGCIASGTRRVRFVRESSVGRAKKAGWSVPESCRWSDQRGQESRESEPGVFLACVRPGLVLNEREGERAKA